MRGIRQRADIVARGPLGIFSGRRRAFVTRTQRAGGNNAAGRATPRGADGSRASVVPRARRLRKSARAVSIRPATTPGPIGDLRRAYGVEASVRVTN